MVHASFPDYTLLNWKVDGNLVRTEQDIGLKSNVRLDTLNKCEYHVAVNGIMSNRVWGNQVVREHPTGIHSNVGGGQHESSAMTQHIIANVGLFYTR